MVNMQPQEGEGIQTAFRRNVYALFLITDLLERNFNDLPIILPLGFSEILNIFRITAYLSQQDSFQIVK